MEFFGSTEEMDRLHVELDRAVAVLREKIAGCFDDLVSAVDSNEMDDAIGDFTSNLISEIIYRMPQRVHSFFYDAILNVVDSNTCDKGEQDVRKRTPRRQRITVEHSVSKPITKAADYNLQ